MFSNCRCSVPLESLLQIGIMLRSTWAGTCGACLCTCSLHSFASRILPQAICQPGQWLVFDWWCTVSETYIPAGTLSSSPLSCTCNWLQGNVRGFGRFQRDLLCFLVELMFVLYAEAESFHY